MGKICIYSEDMAGAEAAKREIELITKDVEVGDVSIGTVKRIMNFGAFVQLAPNKDGMNIGDKVEVKVTEIDNQNRINLVRKDLNRR